MIQSAEIGQLLAQRVSGISLVTRLQQIQALAQEREKAGQPVAHLTAGEPDFDTPVHIRQAAVAALGRGFTHYTSNRGLLQLRAAVAEKMARDNRLEVDPETEVTITNGGMLALFLSLMATINPGDEVILQDPSFGSFGTIAKLAGAVPVYAPARYAAGRFAPASDAIESRITPRSKVILINSPTNPTGTVYTREELETIGELACRHNLIVLADEVYERLVFDGHEHFSLSALSPEFRERTIIISSLSKTYAMTGWRIGYIVAPKPIIDAAAFLNQNSGRMATSFVQLAAREALLGSQQPVADMLVTYAQRRKVIVDSLNAIPGLECHAPEGTFYVFVRIAQFGVPSFEFAKHLLYHGVAVTPGDFFGPGGEGYMRLSFATDEETLRRGAAGIGEAIGALPHRR